MNRFNLIFSILVLILSGCQHPPLISIQPTAAQVKANKIEALLKFGSDFASNFNANPKKTCAKFIRLHQDGDWRASWVLALTANKTNSEHCLNSEDAILILTTLKSRNKIDPELEWLNQFHLQLLSKIQEKTEKVTQLNDSIDSSQQQNKNQQRSRKDLQQQIADLKKENLDLSNKLEALKSIEASIIAE